MWYKLKFNKLVRSFVLDSEEGKRGLVVSHKVLSESEYQKELINKFHEEALEVIAADNRENLIEEIADCYEVLEEVLKSYNISFEELQEAKKVKKEEKGGFEKRYYINYMECHSDIHSDYIEYAKSHQNLNKYEIIGEYDKKIVDFLILNESKDKIYIQKRSKTRKSYSDCWEFPGGTLEIGETLQACIKRELKEELNLELVSLQQTIYEDDTVILNDRCSYSVLLIEVSGWECFKLEDGKADEFKWIGVDELEILNISRPEGGLSPCYKAALKLFSGLKR